MVRGGEAGADGDVHQRVIALQILPEKVHIFAERNSRGAAKVAAGGNMGKNLRRNDVNAVAEALAVLIDVKRNDGNIVFFHQLRREVAGAVSSDLDFHATHPIFKFFIIIIPILQFQVKGQLLFHAQCDKIKMR